MATNPLKNAPEVDRLFREDLKKSGIVSKKDIDRHRLLLLPEHDVELIAGYRAPATAFIYPDLAGDDTDFLRLKFLTPPPKSSWPTTEKPSRYWQQPNSNSRLYFPHCRPWKTIAADPTQDIYITEGEKKAICGCLNALNALAIGGVSNWKSSKRFNQTTIPDLDLIQWENRRVFLCFDADMITNPHVTKQLNDLSAELASRGVRIIKVVEIPATTVLGPKCGLDDYIQHYGFAAYEALIAAAQDVKDTAELWHFNEDFAYVDQMNCIYDYAHQQWITKNQFFDRTATVKLTRVRVRGTGASATVQTDPIPANKEWFEWTSRRTYKYHDYAPGHPEVLNGVTLNTWRGWGVDPVLGDAQPFIDLIDHLTARLTAEQRHWFWCWLAHPVQNPKEGKMMTAVMLHSKTQGTGKTLLGDILCDLYGSNATTLNSPEQMFGPHNEWLDSKQLITADEVLVGSRRETDRVKNFITANSHSINPKGIKAYPQVARMNWYLTSNHDDALKLTAEDRRWFVVHVPERTLTKAHIAAIRRWRKNGGAQALHYHLLHEVDTAKFRSWEAPPHTLARDEMIAAAQSEVDQWCYQLRDDPDSILSHNRIPIACDLFTETDWRESELIPKHINSSTTTIRNILRGIGFEQRTRITSSQHWPNSEKKLWCLRNHTFWANADTREWAEHYAKYLKATNRYLGSSKAAGTKSKTSSPVSNIDSRKATRRTRAAASASPKVSGDAHAQAKARSAQRHAQAKRTQSRLDKLKSGCPIIKIDDTPKQKAKAAKVREKDAATRAKYEAYKKATRGSI